MVDTDEMAVYEQSPLDLQCWKILLLLSTLRAYCDQYKSPMLINVISRNILLTRATPEFM